MIILTDEVLEYIRNGINSKFFFTYGDIEIPIRAVSSYEMDMAKKNAIEIMPERLAKFLIRIRSGYYDTIDIEAIPKGLFKEYSEYTLEYDYWIVYYGMKDFRDKSFSIDDVRNMRDVHIISKKIINMSFATTTVIREIISTKEGMELVELIYKYKQPLVKQISEITELQYRFIEMSNPDGPKFIADSIDELKYILPEMSRFIHE